MFTNFRQVYGLDINNEPLFLLVNLKARYLRLENIHRDTELYKDILHFVYKGIDLRFFKLLIKYLKKVENVRIKPIGLKISEF